MVWLRAATGSDNENLLRLVDSTPQRGRVTINFERSPNFFHGTSVTTEEPFVSIAEDENTGKPIAVYSAGKREVYVNGRKTKIRYANDLRVALSHRGGSLVRDFLIEVKSVMGENEYCQSCILEENIASMKSVASGRHGLSTFYPYGNITSYIISTTYDLASRSSLRIRRARQKDIPDMQRLFDKEAPQKQFYPVYDFKQIGCNSYYRGLMIDDYFLAFEGDRLVGFVGIWDQTAFKQSRVVDYPTWMSVARPFYNAWCSVFGGFHLPSKGSLANYVYLHTVIARNNSPTIISPLLKQIRKAVSREGKQNMIIAISDTDPLKTAVSGFVYRVMKSKHFLMSFNRDVRVGLDSSLPLYCEAARL